MRSGDQALVEGELWRFAGQALAVAAGANYQVGFTTANQAIRISGADFSIIGAATYSAEFILYERTNYTGGTTGVVRNRNRNFSVPSTSVLADTKVGVTATPNAADIIGYRKLVASNQNQFTIGDSPDFILQPNTAYVLRMNNLDTAAADFYFTVYVRPEE